MNLINLFYKVVYLKMLRNEVSLFIKKKKKAYITLDSDGNKSLWESRHEIKIPQFLPQNVDIYVFSYNKRVFTGQNILQFCSSIIASESTNWFSNGKTAPIKSRRQKVVSS